MYFVQNEKKPLEKGLSEYLFDTSIVLAANLLAGREFSGFDMFDLSECLIHGPTSQPYRGGIRASYTSYLQWTNDYVASPELLEGVRELGLVLLLN
jgi:hypothetical protein